MPERFSLVRTAAEAALVTTSLVALAGCSTRWQSVRDVAMIHSGKVYELRGADGSAVLVAPGLQGRVLTSRVGTVESVGFVNHEAIETGPVPASAFNNFGGQDRFWIGPEAGAFGFYFEPGFEISRETWRVPPSWNEGAMEVKDADESRVKMETELEFANYSKHSFKVRVEREVGIIPANELNEEIGVPLPAGLAYVGSYSLNKVTNIGEAAWEKTTGLPCIWILGQFNGGPRTAIVAPFRAGETEALGPEFNDDYFGKVSEETPERIQRLENAVVFRADARREGKFGIGPRRTTGYAGSFDAERDLLVVCKFDVHPDEPFYAAFTWGPDDEPFGGDAFQSYNADSTANDANTFYEIESVSPSKELKPGDTLEHRHATFCFQGNRESLDQVARRVLGVGLAAVLEAMP